MSRDICDKFDNAVYFDIQICTITICRIHSFWDISIYGLYEVYSSFDNAISAIFIK